MSLIAMAVYCTEENQKDECFERSLWSVYDTTDIRKHRIVLCINSATAETERAITMFENQFGTRTYPESFTVIRNTENLGTARAINKAWALRQPGEHCVKMDDDILIHSPDWVEEMEAAIAADPFMGQVGLKRKDLMECPWHPDPDFKSELVMLPHIPGHPWRIIEKVKHVIGSCVMHSSALLNRVGFLYQFGPYGYDDCIMSHRAHLAGFYSCFLPHINIDHIDTGLTPYQSWKERHAGEHTQEMIALVKEMYAGTKPIYYGPED